MKTKLLFTFAGLLLSAQSLATTTLQISELSGGLLATEVGAVRASFDVAPSYPITTVGNTQLEIKLIDDADSSETVLRFPVYVSAYMSNGSQNSPMFSFLADGGTKSALTTDFGTAASAAEQTSDLFVADLGAGSHVITLQVTDEVARASAVVLPLFTSFVDSDGDMVANVIDTDDDNDGVLDVDDYFPLDPLVTADTDQDGIGDELDTDDDNDGILDVDDADPLNVDHLVLGPPMPTTNLFVLQAASVTFIDEDAAVDMAPLMLQAQGEGLASADAVEQDVVVDTSRDYDAIEISMSDSRVSTQTLRLAFNAYAYRKPEPLPTTLTINSGTVLSEIQDEPLAPALDGLIAVFGATFTSADPAPFVRLDATLNGTSAITISTFGDRSVDDDFTPAFVDLDWDDDTYENDVDVFPEDPLLFELADNDNDGIIDSDDPDDDNDGVQDTADGFPFVSLDGRLDTDGDGIPNECDATCVSTGMTDDADDDNDGIADASDIFPLIGTESVDTDGDGIGNNADPDDDGDGQSDVDEIACGGSPLESSVLSADFDGDSSPDCVDTDDDNDNVADVDDAFPFDSSRSVASADTDGDGIADDVDNCPAVSNANQANSDNDAQGDACDTSHPPIRLSPDTELALPIIGEQLTSPFGAVLGVPQNATAVALNVTVVTPSGAGFITVWPCGVPRPLASNLNFVAGDVVPNGVIASVGSNGSVCFYSSSATDVIVDVAGWFEGSAYTGATPARLVDTRDNTGGPPGRTDANSPLTINVTNLSVLDAAGAATTIPENIGAVALNVTVVSPASAGFITVWPCDVARPLSSNVNYVAGQVVPNGVVAPVSADGTVCLFSLSPTDVVVDLAGWFPGQSFTGSTPTRLVDTRDGTGGQTGVITAADELSVPVHNITLNVGGQDQLVPVTATAAALNVTVVNPAGAGFITIWPCGIERPLASNLNYVIAPIGNLSSVCVYSNSPTDVIVDIAGWFSDDSAGAFVGTTPKRLVDTRDGTGPAPQ
jgi:hypothetical protein